MAIFQENQSGASPSAAVSDTAGVRHPLMEWLHRPVAAWMILLLTLTLTGLGWRWSSRQVGQRADERFRYEADRAEQLVVRQMLSFERMLNGAAGLFIASAEVTRQDWHRYVAALQLPEQFPGVQAVGFIRWLPPEEKAAFEAQVRAEGFSDFAITPPGEREGHAVVAYVEPFEGRNLRAFGYDLWSEPVRRAALERARDTGGPALTGKILLVQETGTNVQPGIILAVPLYRPGLPADTGEQRRAALRGWAYVALRLGDLMAGLPGNANPELGFELFDGEQPAAEALLFANDRELGPVPAAYQPSRTDTRRLAVAGHPWTLRLHTRPAFDATSASRQPWLIAAGGLVINGLVFAVLRSLAGQRRQAEARAREMTADLRRANAAVQASEESLALTLHSIGDAVIATDAEGRIVRMNPTAERLTGWSRAEAVGRPLEEVLHLVSALTREPSVNPVQRVLELGEVVGLANHTTLLARDGREYQIADSAAPIRDAAGGVVGVVLVFSDVSEQYRMVAALRASEERFALVNRVTFDVIWDQNVLTGDIWWNEHFEGIFGYGLADGPLDAAFWRARLHPGDAARVTAGVQATLAAGRDLWFAEYRFRRKDGSYAVVDDRAMILRDDTGQVVRLLGAMQDITDRKRAEAALRASEEKYRLIVDHMGEAVLIISLDLRYVFASPSVGRLYGYSPEEFLAQPLERIMSPASFQEAQHAFAEEMDLEAGGTADPGRTRVMESQEYRRDGSAVWIENTLSFIRDAGGRPVQILCLAKDITRRKRAEEALRQSEASLRLIIATEPECVKQLGPDGSLLQMNPAGLGMIEADSFEQVAHQCVYPLILPEHRAQFQELTERVFRGESGRLEFQLCGRKGTTRWLETHATPLRDERGAVASLLAVTRDITAHKAAAAALRASEARKAAIFGSTFDALVTADLAGRVVEWNPAAERIFGYPAAAALGQDLAELIVPARLRDAHRAGLARLAATGKGMIIRQLLELPARRADGSEFPAEVFITPLGTVPPLFTGFIRDITGRKEAEARLAGQLDELRRWHDALLDRESRTLELKQEVNQLLAATGQPVRYPSAETPPPAALP